MLRKIAPLIALAVVAAATTGPALAFTTPFTFHCRGNACRAVSFADEGFGCVVVTNYSKRAVHVTLGADQFSDLAPGDTYAPLNNQHCYGYYDGGETANFE